MRGSLLLMIGVGQRGLTDIWSLTWRFAQPQFMTWTGPNSDISKPRYGISTLISLCQPFQPEPWSTPTSRCNNHFWTCHGNRQKRYLNPAPLSWSAINTFNCLAVNISESWHFFLELKTRCRGATSRQSHFTGLNILMRLFLTAGAIQTTSSTSSAMDDV